MISSWGDKPASNKCISFDVGSIGCNSILLLGNNWVPYKLLLIILTLSVTGLAYPELATSA